MTYQIQGANPLDVDTVAQFALGTANRDDEAKEWIYVQAGSGGLTASQAASINGSYSAVATTTTLSLFGQLVGIPAVAIAANSYGWVQTFGACTINVAASCAANVRLNTTATAGRLDDDNTVGAKSLTNVALTVANGGSVANVAAFLSRPVIAATL